MSEMLTSGNCAAATPERNRLMASRKTILIVVGICFLGIG
jgi:hypothetical protein